MEMDSEKILKMEAQCIAEHSPACMAACPFHVDVKAFLEEIGKGKIDRAYKQLEKKIPMVNVLCRICDHPCYNACLRSDLGGAINIAMLERTVVGAANIRKKDMEAPKNGFRAAVAGAGVTGLSAAVELLKKGFEVHLFEKDEKIGGRLHNIDKNLLPDAVLKEELDYLERNIGTTARGVFVDDKMVLELKGSYDAIIVAFGDAEISDEGNLFYSGNLAGKYGDSIIQAAAAGRSVAVTVERYLKGISLTAMRENEGSYETKLIVNTEKVVPGSVVENRENPYVYTKDEAEKEAARCIMCGCNECNRVCVHLRRYKVNIKKYLRQINHNERLVLGNHTANIMINSCAVCGLCTEVCPVCLNLKDMVQESRESMVARGKMPPSAHDFALRDMEYNISEEFSMIRNEPGFEKSSYVFFPGCQMAASEPGYVEEVYKYLTQKLEGGTGLMFGCCGAPASWAGRTELFDINIEKMKKELEGVGNPKIIVGCSTCYDIFKKHLGGFEVVSIWEIYTRHGLPEGKADSCRGKKIALSDACTSRHHEQLQESAREVLGMLGVEIEELEFSRNKTKCCGYGGLTLYADRSMAKEMIKERISESELDYAAYCFMCRDLFKTGGKRVFHIFDFICGKDLEESAAKPGPTISERQQNRKLLKNRMLNIVWKDSVKLQGPEPGFDLKFCGDSAAKLEERLILLKDIKAVLKHAEETGKQFVNPENGHCLSCLSQHRVTYWVEYVKRLDGYDVFNAYSHRMEIVEE
ncbi:MAG: putative Fe-S oxidoreductase [Firmicutes bacterium]|nr:putative Fe-S oxidoreductase [Bacillota bacterium]